jgi:hypothetical protein
MASHVHGNGRLGGGVSEKPGRMSGTGEEQDRSGLGAEVQGKDVEQERSGTNGLKEAAEKPVGSIILRIPCRRKVSHRRENVLRGTFCQGSLDDHGKAFFRSLFRPRKWMDR